MQRCSQHGKRAWKPLLCASCLTAMVISMQVPSENAEAPKPHSNRRKPEEADLQEASKNLTSFAAAAQAVAADADAKAAAAASGGFPTQKQLPPKAQVDEDHSRAPSGVSGRSGSSSLAAGPASTSSGQQLREKHLAQVPKRQPSPGMEQGDYAIEQTAGHGGVHGGKGEKLTQVRAVKRQWSDVGSREADAGDDREGLSKAAASREQQYQEDGEWSPGRERQHHVMKPAKRGRQLADRHGSGDVLSPSETSGGAVRYPEEEQQQIVLRWQEQLLAQGQAGYHPRQQQQQQGRPQQPGDALMAAVAAAGELGAAEEVKHGGYGAMLSSVHSGATAGVAGGSSKRNSSENMLSYRVLTSRRSSGVPLATQGELSDAAKLAIIQSLDPKLQCLVECGTAVGVFSVETQRMLCLCKQCMGPQTPGGHGPEFMPSEFERHGGMAACKKWRFSVKVSGSSCWV